MIFSLRPIYLILILFFLAASCFAAPSSVTSSTFHVDQHFNHFIKEIRCVVCQNQSLADSHAPLANDLREKIYMMMKNKKSDEEIKAYLVKRYGEFILLKPRFNNLTSLLWLFPFIAIFIACFYLWRVNSKN